MQILFLMYCALPRAFALPRASSSAQITQAKDIVILTRARLALDIKPQVLTLPTRLESEP